MYSFPNLEPVCCSMSSYNCCFLTFMQVSQETGKVVWYFHLFHSFSVCCDPAAATAKSLQLCWLCNPIDGSPPGSAVPGIPQARTLEWVAISFFSAWTWKVKVKSLNRAWLLATPWTSAYQAPPSMRFSRQEDWSGVPLSSPCCDTHSH